LSAAWPWKRCQPEFGAYFLFGLGYIAYMTFIVAWLRQSSAASIGMALTTSVMWTILGLATLVAPLIWKGLFNGRRNGKPMAITLLVLALGASLPLVMPNLAGVWLSALLVGSSIFMVPSALTGFIQTNISKPAWGRAMAVATTLFALGQTIGPVAAGWLSDHFGALSIGLASSAAVLLLAALLAATQKPLQSGQPD
jgi:predicted MFS family arabinose efflux permease